MGECHGFDVQPPGRASQEIVTQFTRRHFERDPFAPRKRCGIRGAAGEAPAESASRVADKLFVRIALRSAQPVIEMGDDQSPLALRRQRIENREKHHRVESARDSDQNSLARTKQAPAENRPFNGFDKLIHFAMLRALACEASGQTPSRG